MNAIKQRLLTNWSLVRIMRLGIGVMMVAMSIQAKDWAMGLFGGFFLYQALTNTGCCGAQGCYTPRERNGKDIHAAEEEYEEIK